MGIYMKYGSIEGDATQQGFEGWVNCHHFEWSLDRQFAEDQVGRSQNREAAQARMFPCTVFKEADHSSGEFLKTAATHFKGEKCEIVFLRTGNPGEPYLKFTLTDALIQKFTVATGGQNPERPIEQITLDFTEVEIECKTLDETNVSEETMRISYNAATGQGG
jgi:type VI secretion system secreted protein Hcp